MHILASQNRLGLQRRILLYAAAGLGILFIAWGVISRRGVDTVFDLLLEERASAAESVTAIIAGDLFHIASDVQEDLGHSVSPGPGREAANDAFQHISKADELRFFTPRAIYVVGAEGVEAAPDSLPPELSLDTNALAKFPKPEQSYSFSASGLLAESQSLAFVAIPLGNADNDTRSTAYVLVEGASAEVSLSDYLASAEIGNVDNRADTTIYHIEVIDSEGRVVLGLGEKQAQKVGNTTDYWEAVEPSVLESRDEVVVWNSDGQDESDKALAVKAIPGSDLHLILFPESDDALSVPAQLSNLFIIMGSVGFVGALVVITFTTRRVVKPTEQLTAAAERMAAGDLSVPVSVKAQDEIAQLAISVEAMRRQLQTALDERTAANVELEDRVRERTGQLRNALRQVITAQEGERQRVARDLHDEVVQQLILLSRGLDALGDVNGGPPSQESEPIGELRSTARSALHSLREVSRDLRPSVLDDLGLVHALRWMGQRISDRSRLNVQISSELNESGIDKDESLTLFRIAQEALHNVERHADASTVNVTLRDDDDIFVMTISDDGRGFTPPTGFQDLSENGHFGLMGMSERASLLGGNVSVSSDVGKGTTVTVSLPVDGELSPLTDSEKTGIATA